MNRTNGGANLLALRSHNTALVLDLLRGAGADGISRLELAERTGLTPQAVSKITARLREEGLAVEAGHRASTGGKRRTVLRLVPGAGHAVGVHLDRDALRAVLVDLAGTVVAERCAALDLGAGAEAVVGVVAGEVEVLAKGVRGGGRTGAAGADTAAAESLPALLGVGLALPGPLDHTRGVLHRVTGFPEWDGFPLRDALARRLGVPVVVDKDTNAAALGLAVAGERGSFAYLHLGTGLGAGLVIDGAVHRGARTGAGEFGHQVVQLDGPPCGCGDRGCVEALCLAAVARGDLAEAARVLGIAAGNLIALLDIDLVLLGGRTIATARDAFLRGVAAVLDERARRAGEEPVPVRAAPGEVADGAAQLVLGPLFGRADA
ncbi:ROK family transcriptional regulator [Streptomyces canus]